MFEIVFDNAKIFKDCIDALVTLIDEGEFQITKEGIKLRAMDPSQIAMVDFVYPKSALEKYEVPAETKLGMNLDDLSKVTSRVRAGEKLTLKMDKNGSRLDLIFKGKTTRRFSLPLIDVAGTTPKQPKIEFDSKVKINGFTLKEGLKDASLISSHVVLKVNKEGFTIEAQGDKGEVLIEAKKDDDVLLEHTVNAEARSMYPLEYLNDLLKTTDNEAVVMLDLKTDNPLRIEYPIGQATIVYYLAPRIENA
jgi:proliferating cell nuclear antigen